MLILNWFSFIFPFYSIFSIINLLICTLCSVITMFCSFVLNWQCRFVGNQHYTLYVYPHFILINRCEESTLYLVCISPFYPQQQMWSINTLYVNPHFIITSKCVASTQYLVHVNPHFIITDNCEASILYLACKSPFYPHQQMCGINAIPCMYIPILFSSTDVRNQHYTFYVWFYYFFSDPHMPGNIHILNQDIQTTSLKISWGPVESGQLDYYDVMISPKDPQTHSPV